MSNYIVDYALSLVNQKVTDPTNPYGGQCISLVNHIVKHFTDKNVNYTNAIDTLTKAQEQGFTVTYDAIGKFPKAGDFFVLSNTGTPYGHIGMMVEDSDGSKFETIEQNVEGYSDTNGNGINDQLEEGGGGYTRRLSRVWKPDGSLYSADGSYLGKVVGWFSITPTKNIPSTNKEMKVTVTQKTKLFSKNDIVLDVASYQADNLASTTAQAGTSLTFIKATEGTSYTNPKRVSQTSSSTVKGYYHFARFGGNSQQAQAEVNYFLSVVGTGDNTKFGILDYEADSSGDKNANTQAILTFMRAVKNAGYLPLFYSYTSYMSNFNIDTILAEFPNSFWEAWYLTTDPSNSPTWDYQNRLSGKASIWQWTDNYKGLNVDASVVLKDIYSTQEIKTTVKEITNMDIVMRSKSGKQGYVGAIDGAPFGISDIGTVTQLMDAGAKHITTGNDKDFGYIYGALTARHDAIINQAKALQDIAKKLEK